MCCSEPGHRALVPNSLMAAKTISKARFEALTFSKSLALEFFVEEREWYADQQQKNVDILNS